MNDDHVHEISRSREDQDDIRHNMHNRDDQSAESREVQAVSRQNLQQVRDQPESPHVEVDIPPVTRTDYWTNFIETFKRTLKNFEAEEARLQRDEEILKKEFLENPRENPMRRVKRATNNLDKLDQDQEP